MRCVSAKNAFSEAGQGVRRCCWDCAWSSSWRGGRAARNTLPQPAPMVCRNGSFVPLFYTLLKMLAATKPPLPAPCRILEAQPLIQEPGQPQLGSSTGSARGKRLPKSLCEAASHLKLRAQEQTEEELSAAFRPAAPEPSGFTSDGTARV